jgi:hypothetical protein
LEVLCEHVDVLDGGGREQVVMNRSSHRSNSTNSRSSGSSGNMGIDSNSSNRGNNKSNNRSGGSGGEVTTWKTIMNQRDGNGDNILIACVRQSRATTTTTTTTTTKDQTTAHSPPTSSSSTSSSSTSATSLPLKCLQMLLDHRSHIMMRYLFTAGKSTPAPKHAKTHFLCLFLLHASSLYFSPSLLSLLCSSQKARKTVRPFCPPAFAKGKLRFTLQTTC